MTPQEVIKLIKECGLNIEQPLHDIVADYLITLLEKQIPKKPIRFHEEYDKHEYKCVIDKKLCPTCNSEVWTKRCYECNQLIDWRKEDV